jgi:hypothetical protein
MRSGGRSGGRSGVKSSWRSNRQFGGQSDGLLFLISLFDIWISHPCSRNEDPVKLCAVSYISDGLISKSQNLASHVSCHYAVAYVTCPHK